jgi:hypothetical protein
MKGSGSHARHCSVFETLFFVSDYREVSKRAATWAAFDMVDFAGRGLPASTWLRELYRFGPTR